MSKWQEITVKTTEEAMEAVANLFHEIGAAGVVIEDPRILARYISSGDWDAYELPPELIEAENIVIKGYLPMDDILGERLKIFSNNLAELEKYFVKYLADVSLAEIKEEDWATSWKAYYKPEKIGERIVVVPSWEEYEAKENDLIITLDPGMAFGTGNHPTTAMSIRCLEKYLPQGSFVYDVGTGSGILAIAAAKLGAQKVIAYDVDTLSVEIAQQNALENSVNGIVEAKYNDLLAGVEQKADFIIANIIANVILNLIPQAKNCLNENGYLLMSGIIDFRFEEIEACLSQHDFKIVEIMQEKDWVTVVGMKE